MNKKLDHSLDTVEIKQTRSNRSTMNSEPSSNILPLLSSNNSTLLGKPIEPLE